MRLVQASARSAVTLSFILCAMRAAWYVCDDPDYNTMQKASFGSLPAWMHRKFFRAWDWAFIMTALETVMVVGGFEWVSVHIVILAVRVGAQAYGCSGECPTGAFSQLMCNGSPCCTGDAGTKQVWSAPNRMCPLPHQYNVDDCAPLLSMPDLTLCEAWGCSASATPMAWFVISWQMGTSAFLAALFAYKHVQKQTTE